MPVKNPAPPMKELHSRLALFIVIFIVKLLNCLNYHIQLKMKCKNYGYNFLSCLYTAVLALSY